MTLLDLFARTVASRNGIANRIEALDDEASAILAGLLMCECRHAIPQHGDAGCAGDDKRACPCTMAQRAVLATALGRLDSEQLLALHDLIEEFVLVPSVEHSVGY